MVQDKRASRTAEGVAVLRAIESSKPEAERLFCDPFAKHMIGSCHFAFSRLIIGSGLYDLIWRGAYEFVAARERYIDDVLLSCLAERFQQVVLLGAGFDMRAFRIEGISDTHVFEIDHPATQAAKLEKLQKIFPRIPEHVTFISLDFDKQTLAESLLLRGFDEAARTLFIWQGVTMYLSSQAVKDTLKFISSHSASGSLVVFDYFYSDVLEGKRSLFLARQALKLMKEELRFGIARGHVAGFLEALGFENVRNVGSEDLTRLYFSGSGRAVASGIAIASARVK